MTRSSWTTALVGAALCGLIAANAARAQTAAPAAPAPAAATPAAAAPAAAAPAEAAPAPKKAKVKKKKAKPATTAAVTVQNSRTAGLLSLEAGVAGSDKFRKVLGKLAPGKMAGATVPRGKDCQIDLRGAFDDGQTMEASGIDVCEKRLLNLTD